MEQKLCERHSFTGRSLHRRLSLLRSRLELWTSARSLIRAKSLPPKPRDPDEVLAHIGDSRAILCRAGQAVQITEDHKPDRIDEKPLLPKLRALRLFNAAATVEVSSVRHQNQLTSKEADREGRRLGFERPWGVADRGPGQPAWVYEVLAPGIPGPLHHQVHAGQLLLDRRKVFIV